MCVTPAPILLRSLLIPYNAGVINYNSNSDYLLFRYQVNIRTDGGTFRPGAAPRHPLDQCDAFERVEKMSGDCNCARLIKKLQNVD